MKNTYFLILTVLIYCSFINAGAQAQSCSAGYDCSKRGVGDPAGASCGNADWEAKLVGQESGGSYTISAPNSSARGRYQFINDTRQGISNNFGLPCGGNNASDKAGFDNCPGLQDDYFRALVQENMNALKTTCDNYCGTMHGGIEVTMSGLLAMAHNVGSTCARQWAEGGEGNMTKIVAAGQPPCRDANGTNAVEKYAAAMGGYGIGSYSADPNCGFGYTPGAANPMAFQGPGSVLACDETILEENKVIEDTLNEVNAEIAKAAIQPPTPVEQMTCLDQQLRTLDAAGDIHATPGKTLSQSTAGGPKFADLTYKQLETQLSGLLDIPGSISGAINNLWSGIAGSLNPTSLVGGAGGASGDCDMMEQTWMLNQCVELPQIPSLNDVISGKVSELSGAIAAAPERMIEKVCSSASGLLGGSVGDFNSAITDAANDAMSPITDAIP